MSRTHTSLARTPLLVLTLAVLGAPAALHAQDAPLQVGDEVRVSWWDPNYAYGFNNGTRMATAEVMDFDGGRIMLRRGRRVFAVPVEQLRGIERRVGTKPASAPAMVIGSASGFAGGFLLGLATGGVEGGGADVDRVDAGVTTAVLIGAPLGAIIAWAVSRSRGIYEDVPFGDLVAGVTVDWSGRVGLRIPTGNW